MVFLMHQPKHLEELLARWLPDHPESTELLHPTWFIIGIY